jgi:acyl-CoA thioester hydrolase
VIYGDTDSMGVAYYGNYFRMFEIGRAELFRALDLTYRQVEAKGVYLPVSEAACKYKHPARYDDLLEIEAAFDETAKGSIRFLYRITRVEDGLLVAEGHTRHACVNAAGKVIRPPGFLLSVLSRPAVVKPAGTR